MDWCALRYGPYQILQKDGIDDLPTSAPSNLNFRVKPLQFDASLLNSKLPVDGPLLDVCSSGPSGDFRLQGHNVADAAVGQALAGHATQFAFRHVEPTAVLGGVGEVDPSHLLAGFLGRECFVERPFRMRVQVVADQCDSRRIRITSVE
jgi:hypothetical protein